MLSGVGIVAAQAPQADINYVGIWNVAYGLDNVRMNVGTDGAGYVYRPGFIDTKLATLRGIEYGGSPGHITMTADWYSHPDKTHGKMDLLQFTENSFTGLITWDDMLTTGFDGARA